MSRCSPVLSLESSKARFSLKSAYLGIRPDRRAPVEAPNDDTRSKALTGSITLDPFRQKLFPVWAYIRYNNAHHDPCAHLVSRSTSQRRVICKGVSSTEEYQLNCYSVSRYRKFSNVIYESLGCLVTVRASRGGNIAVASQDHWRLLLWSLSKQIDFGQIAGSSVPQ
ncbi:hypothetical protein LY76DRAFT_210980 [Colletotrichum caudatum]|nr:hypothetical protein LY76DRAFT_210980 [Colletotrichum caudatum]